MRKHKMRSTLCGGASRLAPYGRPHSAHLQNEEMPSGLLLLLLLEFAFKINAMSSLAMGLCMLAHALM